MSAQFLQDTRQHRSVFTAKEKDALEYSDLTSTAEVTVELKNDISIRGTLKSVDQYLNIKLDDITVLDDLKYPHMSSVKNVFIRGSVVRYVHLPAASVDTPLLEDATRRGKKTLFAKHTKQLLTLSQKPLRHPQRPDKDRPIQYSLKATMIPHNVTNRA
ncbi:hypothetical protein D6C98_09704 [Aureobasidium pullulans]|uniref:Sm domain-containing protein n=1 Tax=Aureobasidium pullulans TaxID=5580 RepID=A0A4S9MBU4_AURPU|nr:hypothetical protein D6D24_09578 [Aureobasidium pullulans]THY40248.1 hypothetical protein D6C98_09704 [Aureobasidium pullulans]